MTPLIRRGSIAEASERPGAAQFISVIAQPGARRRLIRFALLGIAAYAVALIWTMPASVALGNRPWRTGVSGTVWNGEAGIAGGSVLSWHWAPLRSLTSLGFAVDWHMTGVDTDLGGRALMRPGSMIVDALSGRTDATILQAIQPNLPFTCRMTMQAEFPRAVLGGSGQQAEGQLLTDAGTCQPKAGGAATDVPPLILTADHIGSETRVRLAPSQQRRRTLMTVVLTEAGQVTITMTPDGAQTLPFTAMPPGASISGEI